MYEDDFLVNCNTKTNIKFFTRKHRAKVILMQFNTNAEQIHMEKTINQ